MSEQPTTDEQQYVMPPELIQELAVLGHDGKTYKIRRIARQALEAINNLKPAHETEETRCPHCGSDSPSHISQDDDGPCR